VQQQNLFVLEPARLVSTGVETGPRFHIPCGQPLGRNGRCSACDVYAAADMITIHPELAEDCRRIWTSAKRRTQRRSWFESLQQGRTVGPHTGSIF
jgi:hypothetical protein